MSRTPFGYAIYAIGGNEEASRLSGDPRRPDQDAHLRHQRRRRAALTGILLASRLSVGNATNGQGDELEVIAAAVIGGISLSGRQGDGRRRPGGIRHHRRDPQRHGADPGLILLAGGGDRLRHHPGRVARPVAAPTGRSRLRAGIGSRPAAAAAPILRQRRSRRSTDVSVQGVCPAGLRRSRLRGAVVWSGCCPLAAWRRGPAALAQTRVFAVVPKSLDNPFFADVEAGAAVAARELGVELQFVGPADPRHRRADRRPRVADRKRRRRHRGFAHRRGQRLAR